jgi:2-methylcitrate dehydratase PrpD
MAQLSEKLIMGDITEKFTDFIARTQFSDLPEDIVCETRYVLLDSLGCAICGTSSDCGMISVKLAKRLGGTPESTIIGTGDRVSCANAAFANGQLINAMDYDAICAGHDSPSVIAAALAIGESVQASGKDLILAIALAHEIDTRIASATGVSQKDEWWGFATAIEEGPDKGKTQYADVGGHARSTFGAAVAAAKILNLSREKVANAIGIAGTICMPDTIGKWLEVTPNRMTKYGPAGWAAQAGVTAALLAEMGFTGDTTIFEGNRSFWRFTGHLKWNTERVVEDLGRDWRQIIYYKHYPSGL